MTLATLFTRRFHHRPPSRCDPSSRRGRCLRDARARDCACACPSIRCSWDWDLEFEIWRWAGLTLGRLLLTPASTIGTHELCRHRHRHRYRQVHKVVDVSDTDATLGAAFSKALLRVCV